MLKIIVIGGQDTDRAKWLVSGDADEKFPDKSTLEALVKNHWVSAKLIEVKEHGFVMSLPTSCSSGERSVSLHNFERALQQRQ